MPLTCHHRSPLIISLIILITILVVGLKSTYVTASPLPADITKYFPVGRTFKGVKFPSYDKNTDVLQSVIEAAEITRVSPQYFDITNLKVKVYDEDKVRTTIDMEAATYHIKTGDLISKDTGKRPTVVDKDFKMTGDKMIVNTVTQITTFKDNVRVVIPNAKKLSGGFNLSKK